MYKLKASASLACFALLVACSNGPDDRGDAPQVDTETSGDVVKAEPDAGLQLSLSSAEEQPEEVDRPRLVDGEPLSEAATERLLARLPALPAAEDKEAEFAFRERSKPAPRTGETIQTAFPPAESAQAPDEAAEGPLKVLRYAPEGDVALAPKLSVTFSQPMVAVTSQDAAAQTQPVDIEPQVEGAWRWIGTRTTLFEPARERFPMATKYTVTVPAGAKSASGEALGEAQTWAFTTPPLAIERAYPTKTRPQPLRPVLFLEFNQRVDAREIADYLLVQADGERVPVSLASEQRIEADERVSRLADKARPNQWIAFVPDKPLPAGTTIRFGLADNAPSAEGPLRTQKPKLRTFRTYDPLSLQRHNCTSDNPCRPSEQWWVRFNNPLDQEAFSSDWISTEPTIDGMEVEVRHDRLIVKGRTKPRTKYELRVAPELRDRFGQTLGEQVELTFHVGEAPALLGSSAGALSVLDPAAKGKLPFYSINFEEARVRIWEVEPKDWSAYLAYFQGNRRGKKVQAPGKELLDETRKLGGAPDELGRQSVDLTGHLDQEGHGHLVVSVEAIRDDKDRRRWGSGFTTWVQATDIALDAHVWDGQLLGWASALADGQALDGVELSLLDEKETATTDAGGLAKLSLPEGPPRRENPRYDDPGLEGKVLVATRGKDVAILPEHLSMWGRTTWIDRDEPTRVLWHTFDDRGMYKPGETVRVKGWVRNATPKRGDRLDLLDKAGSVRYTVMGPRGNELAKGSAKLSDLEGFDLRFDLPDTVNLGYARVQLQVEAGERTQTHSHGFQIQEFRRPEFEVSVDAPAGPHFVGDSAVVDAEASYYAGGGLAGAPVRWTVQTRETQFTPPNRDDYVFGRWQPWWMPPSSGRSSTATYEASTDASGKHHLKIDFEAVDPALPTVVEPSAAVTDVNRQTWSDGARLLVHPAKAYVGIKSEQTFVGRGEEIAIEAIVADVDGKLVEGRPVEIRAARLDWTMKNGEWTEVEKDEQTCELTSSDAPETCRFTPENGGAWRVTAVVRDAKGRSNMSQTRVWVSGGEQPPSRRVEQEDVELIPNKERYQPGETAKIMVRAPFADAEGLLLVEQDGLVSRERFTIDGTSHTLELDITEADIPNVHVKVDLNGETWRRNDKGEKVEDAPKRPAYASGSLNLKVPPRTRTLDVAVAPAQKELAPGTKTSVDVTVRDADGKPVADSEVALVVVDEAVLALSNYELSDPIDSFYPTLPTGVQARYLRQHLLLATLQEAQAANNVDAPAEEAEMATRGMAMDSMSARAPSAPQAAFASEAGAGGGEPEPIALREDFSALAHFAPLVRTDASGEATVEFELPDSLTRYRVMAVAVHADDHFGAGESTMTARLPLMVRPSPPRFLNWGDRMEMPVVVQNQTDEPATVQMAVRATNLKFGQPHGRSFDVPAGDRVEVRFPAVTREAGEAVVQVAVSSGNWADAAQNELPVWTPATSEAFATYGTIDKGAITQPVSAPDDAIEQFGGLEITTSSTAVQELTDAVLYLVDYPFECSEQVASRVMGVAALKDVLDAFDAEGLPEADELVAAVGADIEKLRNLQRPDGGFFLWSARDSKRFPYVSVHIIHALQRAKMKGFEVPSEILVKGRKYLKSIERYLPSHYSQKTRNTIRAYAGYVLDLMGDTPVAKLRKLAGGEFEDDLSLEAMGWLMSALADVKAAQSRIAEMERYLGNRVSETAATAQFTTNYGGQAHILMHSSRRTDAILLDAMMATDPKSDLIPKLVRGLLDHRKKGRWLNTQENVFVLLALDRYFQTYEKQKPNFVARMWLGDGYVGEHAFKGRTTERKQVEVPMGALVDITKDDADKSAGLVLQKDGKGRLYYRIGMRYAPESLELDPADYGFAVERRYEAVDDPADVTRRKDGTWVVKAGARVRVTVSMVAPARRYHVALVDPLPAGFEPLNPALAVTEEVPQTDQEQNRGGYWWWMRPWYEHDNLRDERAEAFSSIVWAGVHDYSYVARATTPGEFVVPPPKAEEMYHPETFGRGATARVVVK